MSCVPSSFQGMGTAEATLRMDNMEVKDEWQDEDFPRYPYESVCEDKRESSCFVFVCSLSGLFRVWGCDAVSDVINAEGQQVCFSLRVAAV